MLLTILVNVDCGTGAGGFKPGNTCAKADKTIVYKKLKDIRGIATKAQTEARKSKVVNRWVQLRSDEIKAAIAQVLGGVEEENVDTGKQFQKNKKPGDVWVPHRGSNIVVEAKGLIIGNKNSITVHDDALYRKSVYSYKTGQRFVTIVVDDREDGKHSGHDVYFKAGVGAYKIEEMHKVNSIEELNKLVRTPPSKLKGKARGELPRPSKKLKEKAIKAKESRNRKDKALKTRKKDILREQARERSRLKREGIVNVL